MKQTRAKRRESTREPSSLYYRSYDRHCPPANLSPFLHISAASVKCGSKCSVLITPINTLSVRETPAASKYSSQPFQETKRVSKERIYEHRSALAATSGLHNSSYRRAGIASEGRQIDIMACCGSLRAAGPSCRCQSLIRRPWVNPSICIGPLCGLRRRTPARGAARPLKRLRTGMGPLSPPRLIFYSKQVNAIDLVSAGASTGWSDGFLDSSSASCSVSTSAEINADVSVSSTKVLTARNATHGLRRSLTGKRNQISGGSSKLKQKGLLGPPGGENSD